MFILWTVVLAVCVGFGASEAQESFDPPKCAKTASKKNLGTYPWFLPMHYDGHYLCSVVVISNEVVLTAAHCVLNVRKDLIRIHMHDQTKRRAVEITIHESYEVFHKHHDVALIRLDQKIAFSQTVSPVCLPMNKQEPGGKTGRVLGWKYLSTDQADALLQVDTNIFTHNECYKMRYKPGAVSGHMFCAGNLKRDICQGDTSGPVVIRNDGKWEIVGITSWAENCGQWGYPQVYVKLLHYVDWICNKMRSMKIDNVECHCSLHRPMTCPCCGTGYNGDIIETEPYCHGDGFSLIGGTK